MNRSGFPNGAANPQNGLTEGAEKAPERRNRPRKKRWLTAVVAVLAVAALGGFFLRPSDEPDAYMVARARYPEADARASVEEPPDTSALQPFFAQSTQTFLMGEEGKNRVYSPLNAYMALSLLAQVTQGESRQQILSLLGSDSMDALRRQAGAVWNVTWRDDETRTCLLANSLWLDRNITPNRNTMELLARELYTSSYQGEMGSAQFDKALQGWLDEQTGGLLKNQARELRLDSETILALASTVSFRARWHHEFSKGATKSQIFHTPAGDVETDFLCQREDQTYYWGDRFSAVGQPFDGGGAMWFLLPGEGVTPEDLLLDREAADFLFAPDKDGWEKQKNLSVRKAVPKFDVVSRFDLEEGFKELGITRVFDPAQSDFTPITADLPLAITQADHAARVVIDEDGCTAAAYTVMIASGAPPPSDGQADFVLDRPFLFCVTMGSGLPLFVGVVNNPR